MSITASDFENLGFWEDVTPEEQITVYGMDFDDAYIIVTDELGKTPADAKASLIVAAYSDADAFQWFKELKNFAVLEAICKAHAPNSQELLSAIEAYEMPKE